MMHWNEMGDWWWAMALGMTAFWIVLGWIVVKVVRGRSTTPADDLARRYARGEIDDAEFERRRALLDRPRD